MTRDQERAIEHDCGRLIARYANLNDAADWDAVADLFAEDARMSRPTAPDKWIVGRQAILAAFQSRSPRRTRHLVTNIVIDVVSPGRVTGHSAMALFLSDDEVKIGSFHDIFVQTTAGWRFAERRGSLTF